MRATVCLIACAALNYVACTSGPESEESDGQAEDAEEEEGGRGGVGAGGRGANGGSGAEPVAGRGGESGDGGRGARDGGALGGASGSGARAGSGGGDAGVGGTVGSGGRGGRDGGAADASTVGGTGGAPTVDGCRVTRPGASGMEASGVIPVCCTPSSSDQQQIAEVFRLLNEHRMANGRPPLTRDPLLEEAMQGHCRHMAEHTFFAHEAPEAAVRSPGMRAQLCGVSASGENIAFNQATPAAVMTTWKNSPGHNANMLGNYKRVGICHYQRRWGQIFGN